MQHYDYIMHNIFSDKYFEYKPFIRFKIKLLTINEQI